MGIEPTTSGINAVKPPGALPLSYDYVDIILKAEWLLTQTFLPLARPALVGRKNWLDGPLPEQNEVCEVQAQVFVRRWNLVGVTGLEPATFCSPSRRATKLRHTPICLLAGVTGLEPAITGVTGRGLTD